ncbi:MAG TPA: MlaD family protein [Candidatus Xenobia bacterium]|nr:MlaD family protein [Candidatus Xenobia bacterium]
MDRREEIKVGLFVIVSVIMVVAALALVGGWNVTGSPRNTYTVRTKFAGGIEPGSPVRYAGMKVGRVEGLTFDQKDPARAVVTISVDPQTPVRTDSTAKITSLGMLGENYVEISAGAPEAALLPTGSDIPTRESKQWGELVDSFGATSDDANKLINDLRPKMNQALDNINDLTNEENRKRVRASLQKIDQILTDAKPRLKTILANFDSSSAKIDKFMDDIKETRKNLDTLLANWNNLAKDDDAEVQRTLRELRKTLARAETAMEEVRRLLVANRDQLDNTIENIEVTTENLREITDTVKQRPSSLVFSKNPPDRKPGEPQKK